MADPQSDSTADARAQTPAPGGRRGIGAWIVVFGVVVLLHRIAVLVAFHADLDRLIDANPGWLTWQYLLPVALREHFFASLLYLQQTPPIPNAILGLADILFDSPAGKVYFCIVLQMSITALSGALILDLLHRLTGLRALPWLFAIVWALGADSLTMEYNSQGQTFYENLAMLLVLAIVWLFLRWRRNPSLGGAALLGLAVSLLALTRATYSYFFIVPLFLLALSRPGWRTLGAYLVGALLLHGAWCVKNGVIYGHPSLATSSWKGLNLTIGLVRTGHAEDFSRYILDHRAAYPAWFGDLIEKHGLVLWEVPRYSSDVPAELRERDHRIQVASYGTNRAENFGSVFELSTIYASAFADFARAEPAVVLDKFGAGYRMMWQPIHTYSSLVLDFFHTPPADQIAPGGWPDGSFFETLGRYATLYLSGRSNDVLVEQGKFPDLTSRPAPLLTIPYLPGAIGFANLFLFHLGLLLVPWLLLSRDSGTREVRGILLLLAGTIAYLAVVSSIAENGENMRFRMSVEPLLWINSFLLAGGAVRFLAGAAARRRPPAEPAPGRAA